MARAGDQHSLDMRMKLEFPVWYRSFTKAYAAWASAPSDLKAPLLLQGPALAKAEGWLLAAPDRLSESQKRFIVRSIAQRARGGQATQALGGTKKRRWQWRRSSDRSLWHLYAVIAVGLWMFSPDIIRDLMEQTLNPPDIYRDLRKDEVAGVSPKGIGVPPAQQAGLEEPDDALPPADTRVADAAVEPAPAIETEDTRAVVIEQIPASTRAQRLGELMQQQLADGNDRAALLIGIEAIETAVQAGEAGAGAASAATALLTRAMVTREQLEPLAPRSSMERTATFCDARTLVTVASDDTLAVWRAGSRRREGSHPLAVSSLNGSGFDRQCSRLLIANADFNIEVRPLLGGAPLMQLHGHEATITAASFSPDGGSIVTASYDGTARIWDARTGRLRHLLSGHDWHVTGAEFSPDGRRVLTSASDMTARIWDAASGREITRLAHQGVVTAGRFSADGQRVLTTSWDGYVRVWDGATGKPLQQLVQPGGLAAAEASRDGRLIAAATSDGGLGMWDAATGKLLHATAGIDVRQMMFTSDSKRLIALSWSNGVEIHDAASGAVVTRLAGPEQKVVALARAADRRSVTGISETGLRLTWPLIGSPGEAVELAKEIAPQCLTPDERATLGMDGDQPAWCATIRPRDASLPCERAQRDHDINT